MNFIITQLCDVSRPIMWTKIHLLYKVHKLSTNNWLRRARSWLNTAGRTDTTPLWFLYLAQRLPTANLPPPPLFAICIINIVIIIIVPLLLTTCLRVPRYARAPVNFFTSFSLFCAQITHNWSIICLKLYNIYLSLYTYIHTHIYNKVNRFYYVHWSKAG